MTPDEHATSAERLLDQINREFDEGRDRETIDFLLQQAQVHATLATVRPALPAGDLVPESLLHEAEREREIAIAAGQDLRRELGDLGRRLDAYGHRQPGESIGDAVSRLIEWRYNDEDPRET